MKKILSILTLLAVLVTACGCNSDTVIAETMPGGLKPSDGGNTPVITTQDSSGSDTGEEVYVRTLNSMKMTLGADNGISTTRYSLSAETPMGEEGTWTIFVYLCGGEAERLYGSASKDIEEMIAASKLSDKLRFVVQTGGSASWSNTDINPQLAQRFLIRKGVMAVADEQAEVNMGETASLSAFLKWGVKNHPAEKMGVVFYGHGGGSINGVCLDDRYSDSLTLREIDAAMLTAFEQMTDKFEFIGFDAPMMASLETANILATYADYMYACEELMHGSSWDYTAFGEHLFSQPESTGATMGVLVGDYYINSCDGKSNEKTAAFSVTDLSKADSLVSAFNTYIYNLYGMTDEAAILVEFSRGIHKADTFGGNNSFDGYANLIDLAGITAASPSYVPGKDAVSAALSEAVVYTKNGTAHSNACGLSVYYPLNVNNSTELAMFESVAVSPYHLALVDRIVNGVYKGGFDSLHMSDTLISRWGSFTYGFEDYYSDTVLEDYEYTYTEEFYDDYYYYMETVEDNDYWLYADSCVADGQSGLIEFTAVPESGENGGFGFTLSENALYNTEKVEGYVYQLSEDGEEMYEMGIAPDVTADWGKGIFSADFDGKWIALPDGQRLSVYPVSRNEGFDIYSSYVLVNGNEAVLRIVRDYMENEVYIEGVWGGIDEYGVPGISPMKLTKDDKITPLYYTDDVFSDDVYITEGEEYVFDGRDDLQLVTLEGDYLYGFNIHDICGNYLATDYVFFTSDGETVKYQ